MSTFHIEDITGVEIKGHTLDVGDAKISINGSPFVNLTNLPVVRRADSIIFDLNLTTAERVVGAEIRIEDQSTPVAWLPLSITIEEGNDTTSTNTLQGVVTTALTDYNASTGQQINAVATAIGLLPTLTSILQGLERTSGPLDRTFKSGDTIQHADSETGAVQATVTQTKV